MNIYLCSTVRNLLFALLKTLAEPKQKSCIVMICDQQNIDVNNYDSTVLPEHVKVKFIRRKSISELLSGKFSGAFFRVAAVLNVKTSSRFRSFVYTRLFNGLLKELELLTATDSNLFLFNDRSRTARLFRLAFSDYSLIEDGLANYYGLKLKRLEFVWRAITFHAFDKRYLGDDKRCHTIFMLKPLRAPDVLKSKVQPVTFIDRENITGTCYAFFGFKREVARNYNLNWVLATQPISVGKLTTTDFDLVIYNKVLAHMKKMGVQVALKIHPREQAARYIDAFPGYELLESKIPIELMILGANEGCKIVSIYSTAGMGFEQYCQRITLIKDDESEIMQDIFTQWRNDGGLLDDRIDEQVFKEKE